MHTRGSHGGCWDITGSPHTSHGPYEHSPEGQTAMSRRHACDSAGHVARTTGQWGSVSGHAVGLAVGLAVGRCGCRGGVSGLLGRAEGRGDPEGPRGEGRGVSRGTRRSGLGYPPERSGIKAGIRCARGGWRGVASAGGARVVAGVCGVSGRAGPVGGACQIRRGGVAWGRMRAHMVTMAKLCESWHAGLEFGLQGSCAGFGSCRQGRAFGAKSGRQRGTIMGRHG